MGQTTGDCALNSRENAVSKIAQKERTICFMFRYVFLAAKRVCRLFMLCTKIMKIERRIQIYLIGSQNRLFCVKKGGFRLGGYFLKNEKWLSLSFHEMGDI